MSQSTEGTPGGNGKRPAASPFMKGNNLASKFTSSGKKKRKGNYSIITVHHVVPSFDGVPNLIPAGDNGEPFEVFGIQINGYGEVFATTPFYVREAERTNNQQLYLDAIHAVPHVFSYINGTDNVQNEAGYTTRLILIAVPAELGPATQDTIETYINDTFLPALATVSEYRYENSEPRLADEWYFRHEYMNEILGNDMQALPGHRQLHQAINFVHAGRGTEFPSVGDWLRASRAHLYSLFPVGGVPAYFTTRYLLRAQHLAPEDANRLPRNV